MKRLFIGLIVLAFFAPAYAQQIKGEGAMKPKEGSKPIYKIKTEKNIYIKMRDGVKVAVDVYRPDV